MRPNPSLILSEYTLHLRQVLNVFNRNVFNDTLSFEIDCTSMPKFEQKGYEKSAEFKALISTLDGNGRNGDPAVYWFEIISIHTAKDIHHIHTLNSELEKLVFILASHFKRKRRKKFLRLFL